MSRAIRVQNVSEVLTSGMRREAVLRPAVVDRGLGADEVIARLEAAGATLLALPSSGYRTGLRQMKFDIVHTALEAYGWDNAAVRPPMPSASDISRMDDSFGWLALIPEEKYVLRRLLGARALVHPLTGRHLYPWRRLALLLGSDHKAVKRWHQQAVDLVVSALAG